MASWYRRFIPNFTTIVQPMTKLLRKSVKWRWDTEEQAAFDTLKERLTSAPTNDARSRRMRMTSDWEQY